jgi:hypothetical protein
MLLPQVPALLCSTGLIAVLLLVRAATLALFPLVPSPVILFTCVVISAVYYVGFVLLSPFDEIREIVHETAHDFAPALARRLTWLTPAAKKIAAVQVSEL